MIFPELHRFAMALKAITSPVPESLYLTLTLIMLFVGLIFTASFFRRGIGGGGGCGSGICICGGGSGKRRRERWRKKKEMR